MKWRFKFSRQVRSITSVEIETDEPFSLTEALAMAKKQVSDFEHEWQNISSSAPEMEHWETIPTPEAKP